MARLDSRQALCSTSQDQYRILRSATIKRSSQQNSPFQSTTINKTSSKANKISQGTRKPKSTSELRKSGKESSKQNFEVGNFFSPQWMKVSQIRAEGRCHDRLHMHSHALICLLHSHTHSRLLFLDATSAPICCLLARLARHITLRPTRSKNVIALVILFTFSI